LEQRPDHNPTISHCRFERKRQENTKKFGSFETVKQEKQLMLMTTQTEKMVIHFSHKDFKKCAVMDKHLEVLFLSFNSLSHGRFWRESTIKLALLKLTWKMFLFWLKEWKSKFFLV
jgi:hypothetical protein